MDSIDAGTANSNINAGMATGDIQALFIEEARLIESWLTAVGSSMEGSAQAKGEIILSAGDASNQTNESPHADHISSNRANVASSIMESHRLYEEIKGEHAGALGQLKETFYFRLKRHASHLLSMNYRFLLTDVKRIRGYMQNFRDVEYRKKYYTFITLNMVDVAKRVADEVEGEWKKGMEKERRRREASMDDEDEDQVPLDEEGARGLNILRDFRRGRVSNWLHPEETVGNIEWLLDYAVDDEDEDQVPLPEVRGLNILRDIRRDRVSTEYVRNLEWLLNHADRKWKSFYFTKWLLMTLLGYPVVRTDLEPPRAPIMELSLTYDIIRGNVRGSLGEMADDALSICHQGTAPYISAICHIVGVHHVKDRSLKVTSLKQEMHQRNWGGGGSAKKGMARNIGDR
jgi:hypothetical protein